MLPRSAPGTKRRALAALASVGCALVPALASADPSDLPPEAGYNYGDIETPRITAVGGALRATSNSTSALFINPANMAVGQVYHVSALAQIYPEAGRQSYGGAIVDSVISSTGISGGISGVWSLQDPDGIRRESTDFRAGLALPIADVLFVGVAGKAFALSQSGVGPLGQSYASGGIPGASVINTFTFDAGATLRPIPEFAIAVTGHNLTNPDHAFLPLTGGVGIGVGTKDFSLGADAVMESRTYQETRYRFMGGGEVLIADMINVRGGYRFDEGLRSHSVSFGLGYLDRKFSVDVSGRRSVSGVEYTSIVFGFSIHIEAMGLGGTTVSEY